MNKLRILSVLPLFSAACCAPVTEPAPTPAPVSRPAPAPVSRPMVQQPAYDNWLDAPQTPGDWSYVDESGESFALFTGAGNKPVAVFRCDKRSNRIGLGRYDLIGDSTPIRIQTETRETLADAQPLGSTRALAATEFANRDPIVEAIAFSRGRFAFEMQGFATLYLPAWPELTRVIEDCR